jgi:uncharacterized membrane protein
MKANRPGILTFFCILGFLVCFLGIVLVFSPAIQSKGRLYGLYTSLNFSFSAVCYGGFWLMRRWAVWAYAGLIAVNQAVNLAYQIWTPQTLLPLIVLATAGLYYRRME